jgi:hypothetical protein
MSITTDRARRHTARSVIRRIDDEMVSRLSNVADHSDRSQARLDSLDREWDIDRVIETEAAAMGLLGLTLGVTVNSRLLAMPGVVGAAVFLFALRGIYPLLPLFRRLGVRTAVEIERERYAVKALRGDFAALPQAAAPGDATNLANRTTPGDLH